VIEGFGFEQADLIANRAGRLTDRQIERIRRELRRRIRIVVPLLALGPAVAAIVVFALARAGSDETRLTFFESLGLTYVVGLLIGGTLIVVGLYSNYIRPIKKRSVTSRTGPIKLIERGADIHMQIGGRWNGPRFAMPADQAKVLTASEIYTVYFTPGGKHSIFHSIDHTPPLIHPDDDSAEAEKNNGNQSRNKGT